MLIFYPIPHASRCVRKSFAGIRWREGLTILQMTWAEVDAALAERARCAS